MIFDEFKENPLIEDLVNGYRNKRVFMTGGTGFFGLWIIKLLHHLNSKGANVELLILTRSSPALFKEKIFYIDKHWIQFFQGDVRDFSFLPSKSIDFVIHAATDTSKKASEDPVELYSTIVDGARRVLDFSVKNKVGRVLLTGSGAQYGYGYDKPVSEQYINNNVLKDAYALGKSYQEELARTYCQKHGIDVILTRCFSFSGLGIPLNGHFAIGNFVRDALFENEIRINSSGASVRSYLHGSDLAVWILYLLIRGESCQAYNVGSDLEISIHELAIKVCSRLCPGKIVTTNKFITESTYYVPSIDKARNLGLDVWTSLSDSIDSMNI